MRRGFSHEEIVEFLEIQTKGFGLSLYEFYELGHSAKLGLPALISLWDIWGNELGLDDFY